MNTRSSNRFFRKSLLVGALALAVLVAGCTSSPTTATTDASQPMPNAAAGAAGVRMIDLKYSPATLTVGVGTLVTWTNDDAMGHTVTPTDEAQWGTEGSDPDPAKWLQEGESWSFTFTQPGTYKYYCIPHASKGTDGEYRGMVGSIVVQGEGTAATRSPSTLAILQPFADTNTVTPSPIAPPRILPDADGIVRIRLETIEVKAQLADGVGYEFWTFGGTVPGPMLRVREGDTVEFTLTNAEGSTHPHSIDLHAVTGPGGGAKATQTPPGGSTSFRFKAINQGIFVYHCATPHIPTHVANGMYGLILVEPAEGLPPVDKEFYVVQGETYTEGALGASGLQPFSIDKMLDERPEYYTFNGRVGALTGEGAMTARVNETIRIYFGVGTFKLSSFHVIGEIFDAVYPEGGFPVVTDVQTTLVPAGGATMVDFKVEVPGTYILVDHALTRAIDRGAAGLLVVTGNDNPEVFEGATTGGSGH